MTRSELVAAVYAELAYKIEPPALKETIRAVVDTIFEEITEALAKGERVELRDFATFTTRQSRARIGRNPRTGEPVAVPEKHKVYFRPGRAIQARLNQDAE